MTPAPPDAALQERLSLAGYRTAWRLARRVPGGLLYPLAEHTATRLARRGGSGVARLRDAYRRVQPDLPPSALDALVADGMRAYARYWCDLFRADAWTDAHVDRLVRTEHLDRLHHARARSGGAAILWLGHLGSWDLAGRWSARHVAPVTTVAERLRPAALFDEFVAARARQRITVLPLTGSDPPFPTLLRTLRAGSVVALVADRDLTGTGVTVQLCGHPARTAAGPAALARATGAPLVPVFLRRDETDHRRGERRHVITIGRPEHVHPGPDRVDDICAATQALADQLGDFLREHTAEWHMLQRVFEETP